MKKIVIALAAVLALTSAQARKQSPASPVLMTVNGKDVTLSEFEYLYNKSNSQQAELQTVPEYLDLFVNFKLKVADAEAARLDTTASFVKEFGEYRHRLAEPYLIDSAQVYRAIDECYRRMNEEITASHIMVTKENAPELLDSIRKAILRGDITFEEAAVRYSDDPSAPRTRGNLGIVTVGATPCQFEDALYATPAGEISPVVFSGIGYHLIRVEKREPASGQVHASHILIGTRGISDEQKAKARGLIDSLYTLASGGADFAALASRYSQDPGSARNGGELGWFGRGRMVQPFDSISFALKPGEVSMPFATDFGYHIIKKWDHRDLQPLDSIRQGIMASLERNGRIFSLRNQFVDSLAKAYSLPADSAVEAYLDDLALRVPEYGNLLNEYRDGILLFDISNAKVWDKAASDENALHEYFEANRSKYTWDAPRYKGYVLYAANDSILGAATDMAARAGDGMSADSLAADMRRAFGKQVKIERVLTRKGDNPVVDYVAFGGPKARPQRHWRSYAALRGKVIDQPESFADVRGQVTTDYQAVLEARWIDELHKRYPVKINKKVLRQVK